MARSFAEVGQRPDHTAPFRAMPPYARTRFWSAWGLVFGSTVLIVGLATLPPFVGEPVRSLLMHAFSGLCHQIPARSPHVDGTPLAVCHRCYGIYGALPVAALVFLFLRRKDGFFSRYARYVLPASLLLPGADWLADLLGVWTNTPLSRLLTGAVFGLVAGYYLMRAVVEALYPKAGHRQDRPSATG